MKNSNIQSFSDRSRKAFLNSKKIEFKFNDGISAFLTFDVVENFTRQIRGPETYEVIAKMLNEACIGFGKNFTDLISIGGNEILHTTEYRFSNDALSERGSEYHELGIGHFIFNERAIDDFYYGLTIQNYGQENCNWESIFDVNSQGSDQIEDCIVMHSDIVFESEEESSGEEKFETDFLIPDFSNFDDSEMVNTTITHSDNSEKENSLFIKCIFSDNSESTYMLNLTDKFYNEDGSYNNNAFADFNALIDDYSVLVEGAGSSTINILDTLDTIHVPASLFYIIDMDNVTIKADLGIDEKYLQKESVTESSEILPTYLHSIPLKFTFADYNVKFCSFDITNHFNSLNGAYEVDYFTAIQNKVINYGNEIGNPVLSIEHYAPNGEKITINHNRDLTGFSDDCDILNELAVMDFTNLLTQVCPDFTSLGYSDALTSVGGCFDLHDLL